MGYGQRYPQLYTGWGCRETISTFHVFGWTTPSRLISLWWAEVDTPNTFASTTTPIDPMQQAINLTKVIWRLSEQYRI
jgi:hypothetical protein